MLVGGNGGLTTRDKRHWLVSQVLLYNLMAVCTKEPLKHFLLHLSIVDLRQRTNTLFYQIDCYTDSIRLQDYQYPGQTWVSFPSCTRKLHETLPLLIIRVVPSVIQVLYLYCVPNSWKGACIVPLKQSMLLPSGIPPPVVTSVTIPVKVKEGCGVVTSIFCHRLQLCPKLHTIIPNNSLMTTFR